MTEARDEILRKVTKDQDDPFAEPNFEKTVQETAQDFYDQYILALKNELQKEKYSGKSDEEVVAVLNSPVVEEREEEIQHESIFNEVVNEVRNQEPESYLDSLTIDPSGHVALPSETLEQKVSRLLEKVIAEGRYGQSFQGNSDEETRRLITTPFVEKKTNTLIHGSTISQIFQGIPYAPNTVTVDDVQKARA